MWGVYKLLKVVIAEDDDIFRQRLIDIISNLEGIQVVNSTNNGQELLNSIRKIKPEIIITDIDMPQMTGIDAIKAIREEIPYTEIIFITSYDQYLKDAVKLYAFDFIEKESDIERLVESIERIKKRYIEVDKMVCFNTGGSSKCVRSNDIIFVEALDKKTKIYTTDDIFVSNNPLIEVKEMLNEKIFFRSSRFNIINLTKILSIEPYSKRSLEIHFKDKDWTAYLSKVNKEEFRRRIKNL